MLVVVAVAIFSWQIVIKLDDAFFVNLTGFVASLLPLLESVRHTIFLGELGAIATRTVEQAVWNEVFSQMFCGVPGLESAVGKRYTRKLCGRRLCTGRER